MRSPYYFLLVLILLVGGSDVFSQAPQPQAELAAYIKANYTKREVMVPVRDGVKLFTSIYEPKDRSQKYPILLNRTPYSVRPYGPDEFRATLGPNPLFAREGYIFVYQDVRGRWMSEGEFENARPDIANTKPTEIDESTDTYDTIEWLIKNVEGNNGRVGTYGISYPGFYVSAGMVDSHPALKACSPQAPVSAWFNGDDMHHNGALFLAQNFAFFSNFGQPRPRPVSDNSYLTEWKGPQVVDAYNYFLQVGGLKEVADEYEKNLGFRIKFWDEMMARPNYDSWWKERNILYKLKNVKCAVMTVGGWYDNENLYGALKVYENVERMNPGIFNVLVVGPWDHGGWSRADGDWLGTAYFTEKTGDHYRRNIEIPFFDHFLKGKGSIDQIKEVNAFDTGADTWRSFAAYEPENGMDTSLYLMPNGGLSFEQPKSSGHDEYVSDPMRPVPYTQKITRNYPRDYMTEDQRFASTRPDVLVYQTEPLDRDITVAGNIKPSLFISSSGTDSDFIVKLIDVHPDYYRFPADKRPPENSAWSVFQPGGYQMLLRGEPMPARFRNSFEKPEPLVPNQPTRLSFVMPGVTHTFKQGHRIMVHIQSTWFPLVARNPQQYMANYKQGTQSDFRKVSNRVYFGGSRSSAIILPVMK
ncbi:MAG: CocE/NonD family hydrolase [Acidobacteria bacterium]|nr:CocE/NonD family hydrolase [Acidobacteriota bacterium]